MQWQLDALQKNLNTLKQREKGEKKLQSGAALWAMAWIAAVEETLAKQPAQDDDICPNLLRDLSLWTSVIISKELLKYTDKNQQSPETSNPQDSPKLRERFR